MDGQIFTPDGQTGQRLKFTMAMDASFQKAVGNHKIVRGRKCVGEAGSEACNGHTAQSTWQPLRRYRVQRSKVERGHEHHLTAVNGGYCKSKR